MMSWNGEALITDQREAAIWFSTTTGNNSKEAANALPKNNQGLDAVEIESARPEAAQHLEATRRHDQASY